MKYKILQIEITRELASKVNAGETVQEFISYQNGLFSNFENIDRSFYKHVATIEAQDLDEVFKISNLGPEESVQRHGSMRSLSVGDIVIDASGTEFFVASDGFTPVSDFESLSPR